MEPIKIDDISKDIIEYDKITDQEKFKDEEINSLKKHKIFKVLEDQINFDKVKKKLKCFKIVQKRDKNKVLMDKLISLRNSQIIGVTHYDNNLVRNFTTGVILYDKLLFYKIGDANHVKILLHTVSDRYKDGTSSNSVLCDNHRPYTLKAETSFNDNQELLLKYCVHVIRILIDDTLLKDLMNYTKNNSRLLILVFLFGLCGGLFIGGIMGLIISVML